MERHIAPKFIAASLLLGLGLAVFPVSAGTDSWSVAGSPSGGGVYKVIVNPTTPSTLYATSGPGVFESTDSGATWTLIFPTLNGPSDLVMDPQAPGTLYVAYDGDSTKTLFKTTDGGATWTESDTGIGTVENGTSLDGVGGLAIDPVNEGVVYATSENTGLYKSSDGGGHWSQINTGLSSLLSTSPNDFLSPITIDPVNPQVLYLATEVTGDNGGYFSDHAQSGLYQSTDGGAHWTQRMDHMGISNIVVDPSDDQTVYATGLGLYMSTDGGAHWSAATSMNISIIKAIDPTNSLHMWGSYFNDDFYETTDGGANWNLTGPGGNVATYDIVMDLSTPANLYIASNWGVFKSADSGTTWAAASVGIHSVVVDSMMEGTDGIVYLASQGTGIYKSADQGANWEQVGATSGPTGSLPAMGDSVEHMVEDPTASTTLYAGTDGGIFKSIDGGDSWTETDTGIPGPAQTLYLAVDPEAPATLYAATSVQGVGLYKSVDGGASWRPSANGINFDASEGGMMAVAVDPHNSNVVYAGAFFTGLFKSVDGGATWQPDNGAIGVTNIWSVAVDPNDSNTVYTATSNGFFKSTDAGATWTESDYGLGGYWDMTNIQFDPSNTSIIYVTQRYGIGDAYVSPDAGYTWYDMSTLTPSTESIAPKTARHPPSRGTLSLNPGHSERTAQTTGGSSVSIRAAAIGPHVTKFLGGGSDGQVYSFDVKNLPKGGHTQTTGGGGGGSSTSAGATGSGGGGNFGLLLILGLAGFAAWRRR